MSGLQGFLQARQHARPDSPRQVFGGQYKVPVPATKLDRTPRPSYHDIPRRPSTQRDTLDQEELRPNQAIYDHVDAFDTDAEGLDDTTVTSSSIDNASLKSSLPGHRYSSEVVNRASAFHRQLDLSRSSSHARHYDEQRHGQLEPKYPTALGDYDSEEEGEDEEEEEDEDEEALLDKEDRTKANYPKFSPSRQVGTSPSKQEAMSRIPEPSAMSDFASKAVGSQASGTLDLPLSRTRNVGSDVAETNVDLQQRLDTERMVTPPRLRTHQLDPGAPSDLPQKLALIHQSANLPSPTSHQPPMLKPPPRGVLTDTKEREDTFNDSSQFTGHIGTMLPPPLQPNNAGLMGPQKWVTCNAQPGSSKESGSMSTNPAHFEIERSFAGQGMGVSALKGAKPTASEINTELLKHDRELDYSLEQLSGMDFQQLHDEAFNFDPKSLRPALPSQLVNGTLLQKLDYLVKIADHGSKVAQQEAFLSSLPIEEYEECGELLVERFSDIVKDFKNARQGRRRAVKAYEEEVARREARVRGKMDDFEKDFVRLKRGGEDVVKRRLAL